MSDTSIKLKIENNTAWLTLNRPDVFNSFNREMAFRLQDELDTCEADPEVRAIVITGEGRAFCAGQDLGEVTNPDLKPGFKKILEEHYNPIISRIRSIEKPIIGAVNGVAAGAGANIALACDVVVASERASFIQAGIKIGDVIKKIRGVPASFYSLPSINSILSGREKKKIRILIAREEKKLKKTFRLRTLI